MGEHPRHCYVCLRVSIIICVRLPLMHWSIPNSNGPWSLQLCFGGIEGQDSCGGDSGGPLMMSEFSAPPYTQIGVVSYGPIRCGKRDVPGVYTSVPKYRGWIDENMRP